MASWWNSAGASNFTRGLTSITGQISSNFKDILSEASEETYDPVAELTRAKQHIEDLELRKETLVEECASLKKQCDELTMQKQAVEIKSDMLLAESRRVIEEKDNELKRLRENTNAATWNNTTDLNNTWTDILEDDQPEINEYLRYQRTIRDLKDENSHLRDELANLRKTFKAQQAERDQSHRDNEISQLEQAHAEQMSTCRRDYDEQIQKLQSRIAELEEWNKNHQEEELQKSIEVQKDVDDVDKDLLSQELEQANEKLNWYNEKFKEFINLQSNMELLVTNNKQLENELQLEQQNHQSALKRLEQFEANQQIVNNIDDLTHLLTEERQRCDALAADNDSMFRLLEETRVQHENQIKEKDKQIEDLNSQINNLQQQLETKENEYEKEINELQQFKEKQKEEEEHRLKESKLREMLEKQLVEVNEDLQTLENEKMELHNQIDDLKDQLQNKERQIQS
ncbi:unnamed protein product, partial [Adineta ricciae]